MCARVGCVYVRVRVRGRVQVRVSRFQENEPGLTEDRRFIEGGEAIS